MANLRFTAAFGAILLSCSAEAAQLTIKVPCMDMGDGRTLADGEAFPADWPDEGFAIISIEPNSNKQDETYTLICTVTPRVTS